MHACVCVLDERDLRREGSKKGHSCMADQEDIDAENTTRFSKKVQHWLTPDPLLLPVVAQSSPPSGGCRSDLPPLMVAGVISPLWWLQVKCEQYWPPHEGSSVTFGRYTITSIKVTEKAHFTHRMLDITKDPSQVIYVGADSVRV